MTAFAVRPDALLLDFGGVVFLTSKHADGRSRVAALLAERLHRAGHDVALDRLEASLAAGLAALKDWKNAAGRRRSPDELTPRQLWEDFLASDLDDAERAVLAGDGAELLDEMTPLLSHHDLREGIVDLLDTAAELGVRVGIVSNAHSGRSHRALMREHGLDAKTHVQVYSDEVGIRKPHPAMIEWAATALGTTPERCWYVGDTHDRDLVAGRRANVGAVILTRSQHTDRAPYTVVEVPDAVFEAPSGLVSLLRHAQPAPPSTSLATAPAVAPVSSPRRDLLTRLPRGILLDHGGVISTSIKDPDAQGNFARSLAARLRAAGHDLDDELLVAEMQAARFRHKHWKNEGVGGDGIVAEISPSEFWHDLVGAELPEGARTWLRIEAAQLSHEYALIKSQATLRPGVIELAELARSLGIRLAIVSNTVSGRAVRDRLRGYGLLDAIGMSVYSDELGRRKPDRAMPLEALRGLGLDGSDCWFVGDKPDRDMAAAHAAGIEVTVLVRGGSSDDSTVDRAASSGGELAPELVVDSLLDLVSHLRTLASGGDPQSDTPPRTTPLTMERALP